MGKIVPLFFPMKAIKQTEAVSHVQHLIRERGLDISSRSLVLPDNQSWVVFEKAGRQIGVDTASGIWIRQSAEDTWQCVCMPCIVSGAIQAVEFLTA